MTDPVISLSEAPRYPMVPEGGSDRFGAEIAPVGDALGLTGLGVTLMVVEPGKRAFPFHNHLGNDGAFVILEGSGTYRFGDREYSVNAGDVCGAPKGGPDRAHQLINTGETVMKYLGVSTRRDPEVLEYPDSGKFAAIAVAPGENFMSAHLRFVGRAADTLDYWEGET